MKNRFLCILSAVMIFAAAFCAPFGALAADEDVLMAQQRKNQVVTIECKREDTPLVGMEWKIYRVADIEKDNSYALTDEFAGYKVAINNVTTSQLTAAAETLEAYAYVDDLTPYAHDFVDEEGKIRLIGMGYGVYLLSGTPTRIGENYYVPIASFLVIDEEIDKYDGSMQYNYNITAVPKMKVLAATNRIYARSVTAKIKWVNDNEETRPTSVETVLTKDANVFKTIDLCDDNIWACTWTNCSSKYMWNVIERAVPEGYTVSIEENHINVNPNDENQYDLEFIITNNGNYTPAPPPSQPGRPPAAPADPPAAPADPAAPVVTTVVTGGPLKLPQTGQLWWPVPVLSAAGMVVFIAGWAVNSVKRKRNEE